MRPYVAILSARFRMLLQYRAAALAGFGTQLFWGLIRVMIFEAFYRSSSAPQPMTLQETVTYVWLTQAMFHLLPYRLEGDIAQMVRDGTVAYELARPIDVYWSWLSRAIALRTAPTLLRAIPLVTLAVAFFGMDLPPSGASAAAFLAALVGAVLVTSAISVLASISTLWTISGQGAANALLVLVMILSGSYVPLPLFPDWAQPILNALPFRAIVDVPFRLWSGNIPPQEAPLLILQQLAWAAVLILAGRLLLARGTRRLVVQGG